MRIHVLGEVWKGRRTHSVKRGGRSPRQSAQHRERFVAGGGLLKFYSFFKPVHNHCSDGQPCSLAPDFLGCLTHPGSYETLYSLSMRAYTWLCKMSHELSSLIPPLCCRAGQMPPELCLPPESRPGEARVREGSELHSTAPSSADFCLGHYIMDKILQASGEKWLA